MTKPRIYFKNKLWWVECGSMYNPVGWPTLTTACTDAYDIYWNNYD